MLGSIGFVLAAQQAEKKDKGWMMFYHKSFGVLSAMLLGPRLIAKLATKAPRALPSSSSIEQIAASASHYALYGFAIVMPVTGVMMGYFGGKGLPFFGTTLPGAAEKDGKLAGQSFKIHKTLGTYGKFLIPMHIGAAGTHVIRGHPIFYRINPFGK